MRMKVFSSVLSVSSLNKHLIHLKLTVDFLGGAAIIVTPQSLLFLAWRILLGSDKVRALSPDTFSIYIMHSHHTFMSVPRVLCTAIVAG